MANEVITTAPHVTHGIGLAQAALPRGCDWLGRKLVRFRRTLEAACLEVNREVRIGHALAIDAAVSWERHRQLCYRWLRKANGELTPETRLAFSREAARASDSRNKAVDRLTLDRTHAQTIAEMLYGQRGGDE